MDTNKTIQQIPQKIDLQIHNPFYISRSMLETDKKCQRRLLYNYLWNGIGLTTDVDSIPLTTGLCIHEGPEHLFNSIIKGKLRDDSLPELKQECIEEAVQISCSAYLKVLENVTLGTTKQTFHKDHFEFLKKEQLGITEGLVRAWAYQELPIILRRYEVVSSEKSEVNSILNWNGVDVRLQTRADAVLKKRDSRDTFVYSLKTIKKFSDWDLKGYARGMQVNTEMFGVDQWLERSSLGRKDLMAKYARSFKVTPDEKAKKALTNAFNILKVKHISKHAMGVRFCYLVKGDRKEETDEEGKGTGKWITYNPFIRGYKKINISSIDYASSWITTKPGNKSGFGTLGKGWEPFYIWNEGYSVKKWMRKIKKGEVQPKDRNIIKEQVVVPAEVFRNANRQEDVLNQVIEQVDVDILSKMKRCIDEGIDPEKVFTQNLTACIYPSECEFMGICDKNEVRKNPSLHGYAYRIPHHAAELVQIQALMEEEMERK